MSSSFVPWSNPRHLIESVMEGGKLMMKVNNDTANLLGEISQPLVIISVVGMYRTGKSYLLNRLAGTTSGFELGSTVQAKTKGIWVWCLLHPTKPEYCLLLMDTEGLGDVVKGDATHDVLLFTLVALLSSTLVYNSQGAINQTAIESMNFVTDISERFRMSTDVSIMDADASELVKFFPMLIWVVRDFTLQLELDGKPISPDEYLENSLKLKKGIGASVTHYNSSRRCIRRYFSSRKCFTFPVPIDDQALMPQLGTLSADRLIPEFLERSKEFCDYAYSHSDPKAIGTNHVDGQKFVSLVQHYTHDINKGAISSLDTAVISTAASVNRAALSHCVSLYLSAMSSLVLPTSDEQTLTTHHARCVADIEPVYKGKIMFADCTLSELCAQFNKAINEEFDKICRRNEEASLDKSHKIITRLLEPLQDKIDREVYHCIGGFAAYQADFAAVCRDFYITSGNSVKATTVLQEYVEKYSQIAKGIMICNKKLIAANGSRNN